MTQTGTIFDIKKFAINDGPGIRTTAFFQGCPLSCWWCHNPESQSRKSVLMYRANRCISCGECVAACPQAAIQLNGKVNTDRTKCDACGKCAKTCYHDAREISGKEMSVREVMQEIERDVPFYDQSGGGVTFSGGEPLMQGSFLLEVLRACGVQEIHTVVDTSGYSTWEVLENIRNDVDLFLYDLKMMDDKCHVQYTGVSNERILSNLQKLTHSGSQVHVRIPMIPGINDDKENLRQSAEFVAKLPNITGIELMGYHDIAAAKYEALDMTYQFNGTKSPTHDHMQQAGSILEEHGLDVKIR